MDTCIPSLPIELEESISESSVRSSKRLWGLGGTATATKGDLDVRGGNSPSSPKPNQALEGGQFNSTSSSSRDRVVRGWIYGRIGYENSIDLVE